MGIQGGLSASLWIEVSSSGGSVVRAIDGSVPAVARSVSVGSFSWIGI